MPQDPLELAATPERIAKLVDAFAIERAETLAAYEAASATPPKNTWIAVLDRTLLSLGALLSAAGVVFFFAFNWSKLTAFTKLGLVGAGIVGAVGAAQRLTLARPSGRMALLVGAILVGPLFAVFGQHYQTGADPYELFLAWAFLTVPWAIASRSAVLWGFVLVVFETGFGLFSEQGFDGLDIGREEGRTLLFLAAPLVVAVLAIELSPSRRARSFRVLAWITTFFAMAILSLGAAICLVERTPTALYGICFAATLAGWVALGAVYWPRREVPMLAVAGTSFIGVVTTMVGRLVEENTRSAILTLFVTSGLLIFLVSRLVVLLKKARATAPAMSSSEGDGR